MSARPIVANHISFRLTISYFLLLAGRRKGISVFVAFVSILQFCELLFTESWTNAAAAAAGAVVIVSTDKGAQTHPCCECIGVYQPSTNRICGKIIIWFHIRYSARGCWWLRRHVQSFDAIFGYSKRRQIDVWMFHKYIIGTMRFVRSSSLRDTYAVATRYSQPYPRSQSIWLFTPFHVLVLVSPSRLCVQSVFADDRFYKRNQPLSKNSFNSGHWSNANEYSTCRLARGCGGDAISEISNAWNWHTIFSVRKSI